jgi:hypothetical protein
MAVRLPHRQDAVPVAHVILPRWHFHLTDLEIEWNLCLQLDRLGAQSQARCGNKQNGGTDFSFHDLLL